MTEPWLVYFFIFAAVFLGAQGTIALVAGDMARRRTQDRRFAAVAGGVERDEQAVEIVKRRSGESWGVLHGPAAAVDRLIVQSGLRMQRGRLVVVGAVLWVLAFLVLPSRLTMPGRVLLGLVLVASFVGLVLAIRRKRRIARFGEQLPDVLDVIVRSLRAGHPLSVSLSLVGREMPEPAGPEFAVVFDEVSYGRGLREALENLDLRVGHEDLRFLVTAISVADQTGGNLGEILAGLSRLIRDRFRLKRKVRALSSEGRFSAVALSVVPVFLFGIINLLSRNFYGEVWGNPALNISFAVCAVLLTVGNVVMYRMVNFKV